MKAILSAVQAVGCLVGIQQPALSIPPQFGVADPVRETPGDGPKPHLLGWVGVIGAAEQHLAPLPPDRQGQRAEGSAEIEAAQAQPLFVFQLE